MAVVDLDPILFLRLVKLYLATFVVSIIAAGFELFVYPGLEFSDAFDQLTAYHFKPLISGDLWLTIAGVVILTHLIGAFGLLKLKQWARTLFVWPIIIFMILDVIVLSAPVPFTPLLTLLTFVGSALMGAVMLMAYSRPHGGEWFAEGPKDGQAASPPSD